MDTPERRKDTQEQLVGIRDLGTDTLDLRADILDLRTPDTLDLRVDTLEWRADNPD